MGNMAEEEEVFEDEIDPRIKGELDILNQSTDEINKLETELNECREKFASSLASATQKLQKLSKKCGKAIERARPYYVTKAEVSQAQLALQRAVNNFQRANGVHRAAKETIALAESRLSEFDDKKVDMAWQEMLNIQTMRFMEAERDKTRSEALHERATKRFEFLEKKMQAQKKKHKNSTAKSKPYFDLKEMLEIDLQKKRQRVEELQRHVDRAKRRYRQSLDNLETISLEIHEKRRRGNKTIEALGVREAGEGECDGVGERIPSNPLGLDLVGTRTYDDIEELEAELDDFSLDGDQEEEELSSGSESDAESDESTPRSRRKNRQLKRSNTAPASKFVESLSRKGQSQTTLKRRAHILKRAATTNTVRRSRPSSVNDLGDEDDVEEDYTLKSRGIPPIKEDAEVPDHDVENDDCNEKDEATYRRLHGTNIDQDSQDKRRTRKSLPVPDDFDIFDELC